MIQAEHRVGALGVLLGAAGGQHHHPRRAPSSSASATSSPTSHAGDALDPFGPPGGDRAPYVVEAGGARGDVRLVDGTGRDDQVQQAEGDREIGAGDRLDEHVGALGGGRAAWVDDDDAPAARAEGVEVSGSGRHRLGEVGPHEHDDVGLLDVGKRERQPAVEPEGPVAGRRRR